MFLFRENASQCLLWVQEQHELWAEIQLKSEYAGVVFICCLLSYEVLWGSSLASCIGALQYGTNMFSSQKHNPLACQVDFMLQES